MSTSNLIQMNVATHPLSMTTVEIAELTGKEHKNVLADVRGMLEQLEVEPANFSARYTDAKGESRPCFELPKDLTLTLIAGYNPRLRKAIIDRWLQLEAQNAIQSFKVPTSLKEALALALELESQRELLVAENAVLKPKAEFHDAVASAVNMQTIQEVAKVCNVGPNNLFRMLRESRLLMANNLPFQDHVGRYFAVREYTFTDCRGENRVGTRTYVLPKGLIYIQNLVRNSMNHMNTSEAVQ